jgi:hypothetical protein
VNIKIAGFWDVTPCSSINRYQNFGASCCELVQSGSAEDGSSRSFRNVGYLYARLYGIPPKRIVTLSSNIIIHFWGILFESMNWTELIQDMAQQ